MLFLFLNLLQINFAKKIRWTENVEIVPPPHFKFLATSLPVWVVGEENLAIGFGPPTLEMLPPSLGKTELLKLTKHKNTHDRCVCLLQDKNAT